MAESPKSSGNLLYPGEHVLKNYVNQLRQTIDAYSPISRVIGEAVQNAIDAVCESPDEKGYIQVELDFETGKVVVSDTGVGFPPDISLLYLEGSRKTGKKLMGRIGVGIKVTLFEGGA